MSPWKGQQHEPVVGVGVTSSSRGSRQSRMELDSSPEVIKTQTKPGLPWQNGAQGGHTMLRAPAPGGFCLEQGSERKTSLFLWNLCFFSVFFMP